ncbi:LysR family transcriptional regulator [Pseudoflavonifractor sp. MSJ-37]|uniref:LysR family transcriptional regulator n=1 Tax=Pseudoflavonifractor sp. MSJ-37 TaxID=2841531 RepID=UPI001C1074B2|nr:LysR family transcriptional regulator [Pseudoflavonifractor sp. MSJ-37]MBU5434045.1 LysR family transcriptional regulator [Pseudoflavonifractor sp. MSJ-37]
MKLERFRYLLEVERLRSISAAARSLHVRQTTLSATVKSAEEELGYPIFQRSPGGVAPTPLGSRFLALAKEIDQRYEELVSLKQRTAEGAPIIRLLLAPSLAVCLPIPLTRRFQMFDLRGSLFFQECFSRQVAASLADNASNLGLAYLTEPYITRFLTDPAKRGSRLRRLLSDQLCLIMPAGHPLSQQDIVDIDQLADQRLASAKSLSNDAVLGNVQEKFSKMTAFSDIDIMKEAVLEQDMVAFLPRFTILAEGNEADMSRFAIRPVRGTARPNQLTLCLLQREDRALGYQERVLVSCILDYFQQVRTDHPEFCCPDLDALEATVS